jgi:hypothetical protein
MTVRHRARSRGVLAVVLGATLLTACETKVVDLRLPDNAANTMDASTPTAGKPALGDANPVIKCETVVRADGSKCEICYSAEGMVVSSDCAKPLPAPDGGSTFPVDPSACKVVPMDDTRCALCPSPTGMVMVAGCLKCGAPVKTTAAGDFCRTCDWSDLMAGQCLQCYAADGTSTLDDCDALRSKPATPPS